MLTADYPDGVLTIGVYGGKIATFIIDLSLQCVPDDVLSFWMPLGFIFNWIIGRCPLRWFPNEIHFHEGDMKGLSILTRRSPLYHLAPHYLWKAAY